jgi:hypothetical protein
MRVEIRERRRVANQETTTFFLMTVLSQNISPKACMDALDYCMNKAYRCCSSVGC